MNSTIIIINQSYAEPFHETELLIPYHLFTHAIIPMRTL